MRTVLLVIVCLFLPFVAVLLKDGLSLKVLWAFLLQLLGHVPGVIYGLYRVLKN
ncbi:MAG: YqaE/Pmp3 family membrane protein [Aeromicrobium sp.]|uniref:YqaE/Pmp3 family membrane protein n=1 Tax=Aeromicrobium sp. TaxID=1871063 RepID=UPI003C504F1C